MKETGVRGVLERLAFYSDALARVPLGTLREVGAAAVSLISSILNYQLSALLIADESKEPMILATRGIDAHAFPAWTPRDAFLRYLWREIESPAVLGASGCLFSAQTGEDIDMADSTRRLGLGETVLVVPLKAVEAYSEERLGLAIAANPRDKSEPDVDLMVLDILGGLVNGAINTCIGRARLEESYATLERKVEHRTRELARSLEELKALGEVSRAVSSTLDLEAVLTTIAAYAVRLSGSDGGVIYEYDGITQTFQPKASHGIEEELIGVLQATRLHLGEGAIGRAATLQASVQVPDILDEREQAASRVRPALARLGYRSMLAVPLLFEQRIVGGLAVWRKKSGSFSTDIVNLLQTFAGHSVLAIQNARLFREIEEKSRQLEIASRHKSQFLANMSHELRTPLNAILGYTELIRDNIYGEVPGKIREVLERVDKSGRHLLGLINDVLDLSKIEAGQITLAVIKYSFKDIVQTVVTQMEALAAEKKLALSVSVAPDLPPAWGDERRITQVLLNLIGNAIKFTEAGEVRIEVTTSDGTFLVSVADTGPGISPADQEKIFEEFQQVDSSSTRGKSGTGLGLAIAKRIVELHRGRIWVESAPGRGSIFRFTLAVRVGHQMGRT